MIDEDVLLTRELLKLLMRRISVMKQIKHSISNINSFALSQKIPDARLIVYPDAEHGSLFQFPELFVTPWADLPRWPPAGTETERAP